jgi:hypothetical protein
MNYPININDIKKSLEFYSEVKILINEAKEYIENHSWCKKIYSGWLFTNIGYALNIFLFRIENSQSIDDNLIWVIVGDFPPMYLDTYNISTTKEVVEVYVELASDWISKAESDEPLDDCYPLDAQTDKTSIDLLKKKIEFLEKKILPNIKELSFGIARRE